MRAAISRLTLPVYFGRHFVGATLAVFLGVFALVVLVDYVEMTRRAGDLPQVSALLVAEISLFRVPQATERIMPFAVLVGTMVCYLNLSRRLELVVARASGMSAWQFVAPAVVMALVFGAFATAVYNPVSTALRERSKRLEAEMFGGQRAALQQLGTGFWVRQRSTDGQSIINASASRAQGVQLDGVTVFNFDSNGRFVDRVEAVSATLDSGYWRLEQARIYAAGAQVRREATMRLPTHLTPEQARENFATPETVSFWELPSYIALAEQAGLTAAGYKLQYHLLLARPMLLGAMVLLAASVSLHFFRFGGASRTVLSGVLAGFLLYVLSKVTEDLSKAELMHPAAAAWVPVLFGGLTGFVTLLYQEDG